jgi:hypothetical protein
VVYYSYRHGKAELQMMIQYIIVNHPRPVVKPCQRFFCIFFAFWVMDAGYKASPLSKS